MVWQRPHCCVYRVFAFEVLTWCSELDLPLVMDLGTTCFDTLVCLGIMCKICGTLGSVLVTPII
jgi:hypothetical protein